MREFRSALLKTVVAGASAILILATTIFWNPLPPAESIDGATKYVSATPPHDPTSLDRGLPPPLPNVPVMGAELPPLIPPVDQFPSGEPDFFELVEVNEALEPNEPERQPVGTPLAPRAGEPVAKLLRSAYLRAELDEVFVDGQVGLIVVDPNTEETLFSYEGEDVYTAASVYKLFVAYSILKQVDEGTLNLSSYLAGTTVSGCLEDMITYSDNECAAEWLFEESYPAVTNLAHSIGAENTKFDYADIETSPADVALFLTRLYRGDLLSETSSEQLLMLMKNQIFRDGISSVLDPTSVVAEKIGFLDTLSHDAAIVYSPKGDYILVIFTDGLTGTEIAEAATIIHEWL